jgi:hypothetical protein
MILFTFFPKPRETEITMSVEWNTTASDKKTKQSLIEKEKATVLGAFDLKAFVYDYQLRTLLPLLAPHPTELIFIDIPQAILNIQSAFIEPPSNSTMTMINFQIVLNIGLLYFNITGENVLEHIYDYSDVYGISSYKNRHFPNVFFAYLATKKLFATEGKNTKIMFLYSKEGFNEKLNHAPKEKINDMVAINLLYIY